MTKSKMYKIIRH